MDVAPEAPETQRAIVFSKFPTDFYQKALLPKLTAAGIEVLRVVDPERYDGKLDLKDADLVLAMFELMSSGDHGRIRQNARRAGKRFVMLSRKGDWTELLAPRPALPPQALPPPPSRPVVGAAKKVLEAVAEVNADIQADALPEVPIEELRELLQLFEEECSRLQRTNIELRVELEGKTGALALQAEKIARLERRIGAVSKDDLIDFVHTVDRARLGDIAAFRKLLEISTKMEMTSTDLLPFLRDSVAP